MKYENLFKPITIRGITFKNRVMASPVTTARIVNETGRPSSECIDSYETKARGGVGAITCTETFVDKDRGSRHDHSIDIVSDHLSVGHLESLFLLAEGIKVHGAIASIQLNHVGAINHPSAIKDGKNPIAPSGYVNDEGVQIDEMNIEMMEEVANNFAKAAETVHSAGFEMVMLHGGHGWLLGQFLSPLTNKRTDEYGGSLENRAKFPIMVIEKVRERCPKLLIEYRLSGSERVEGGLEIEEACEFAKLIENKVDIIHVTSGLYYDHVKSKAFSSMFHEHGCNLDLAEAIKKSVSIPVTAVGGFNSPEQIEEAIATGKCDFVAMGRQLLADPNFVKKTAEGREDEIAPCLRCSCFNPLNPDKSKRPFAEPFQCTVNPYSMRELRVKWTPPTKKKNVLVIGGGPGGMYAAITAAERGHDVTLVEKENELGGLLWFTDYDEHKESLKRYKDSLIVRVKRAGVKVVTGVKANKETIKEYNPEAVIVAIGSTPLVFNIKGLKEHAHYALDIYKNPDILKGDIVLIGGGLIGMETAYYIADKYGNNVSVIEMQDAYAKDAYSSHRDALELFLPDNVNVYTNTKCMEIKENSVVAQNLLNNEKFEVKGETILYALGMKARSDEMFELVSTMPNSKFIGDCKLPARVLQAVRDGMFAALDV
ncbi:MAG: FAD-dependent oxidoreductase [Lachnospirales bacterium]